jgi:S-adenosylmethionine/arginine decarboxylase-like enzyme
MTQPSAHLHLIIRALIYNPPGPDDVDKIKQLMVELVEHVRMQVLVAPIAAYCHDIGNEGITSTIILTTSHAALHIWNLPDSEPSIMQFDLYSCSSFTPEEVIEFLKTKFDVLKVDYKFLDRENDVIEYKTSKIKFLVNYILKKFSSFKIVDHS